MKQWYALYVFLLSYHYGISSPLAIDRPQSCIRPFKKVLNFGKSWIVTGSQLKVHELFAKWALTSSINECETTGLYLFWTDSGWFLQQYNVQYQKMFFHAGFGCSWATLIVIVMIKFDMMTSSWILNSKFCVEKWNGIWFTNFSLRLIS